MSAGTTRKSAPRQLASWGVGLGAVGAAGFYGVIQLSPREGMLAAYVGMATVALIAVSSGCLLFALRDWIRALHPDQKRRKPEP